MPTRARQQPRQSHIVISEREALEKTAASLKAAADRLQAEAHAAKEWCARNGVPLDQYVAAYDARYGLSASVTTLKPRSLSPGLANRA